MAFATAMFTLWPFLLVVVRCAVPPTCIDRDEELANALERQIGQRVTCAQLIVADAGACNDAAIETLCCARCFVGDETKLARWEAYAAEQRAVAASLAEAPSLRLRGGGTMPALALGTAGLQGRLGARAVEFALRSGYRAFDTAILYGSHSAVADGLHASGVSRADVFIVSKVWRSQLGFELTSQAVDQMLSELRTDYVDLCLLHWPSVEVQGPTTDMFTIVERAGAWRALERASERNQCRHIGVSNYKYKHIRELMQYARIAPAVNQIEFHPYMVDNQTLAACRRHGIAVQAYGSINAPGLLEDAVVRQVANEVDRTAAQVLLRWAVEEGVMVLPKSANERRILDNAMLWNFALSVEQHQRLSNLHRGHHSYGDPNDIPAVNPFVLRRS
eukprot:TRINITY_DN27387_c0_g1_i2.p1 TRINITY_DN27387_c0_g1~~TRINITY_DN27387_c0_g1_i2.p1  ORF type:complete len:404 (-),score=42.79 TRINITY_DN27387_c0_g1_i2:171-1340(-)